MDQKSAPGVQEFASLTLDQWLTKFGRIYGKRHDKHTTEYMISRLVEEVAELVSPMESQDRAQIAPSLADVFSWICSLAYKLNVELSALTWEKYGKHAPRPEWARAEGSLQPSLADFSQPRTLREWQDFISKVYQKENVRLSPTNALVAMMKDVGDLAMLARKRAPQDQLTSKLAAILAWTLTISELLKLDLAQVVYEKYDDHCPSCGQSVCDTDVCHPLSNMYVSFGAGTSDEEKYAVLDAASKFGYRTLVNPVPSIQNTRDLATSVDLISKSDAACLILPDATMPARESEYKQVFEVLSCYSILSKGNVWVFSRDGGAQSFGNYLGAAFPSEKISVQPFKDSNHLRALFELRLGELQSKRKATVKSQ
jgi:NTP pyrophosphatase (non-canonical NTP hydrolase)